jgi:glycerophosphoryl diester phosphodiesterase
VNDARTMRGVKRLGVDAIITDRPDRLAVLS